MSDPVARDAGCADQSSCRRRMFTDANLLCLVVCRAVNLSLERGNCDASCAAYVCFGIYRWRRASATTRQGYRFGQLGYDLVEDAG